MLAPCPPRPAAPRRRQTGFTLVELMVVVVIIGILASIGLPMYQRYLLAGNVNQAVPFLNQIASKERIFFNRYGYYLTTKSEVVLQKKLGLDLSDAVDFCFMIACQDISGRAGGTCFGAEKATADGATAISAPNSSDMQFQVIGVLRAGAADHSPSAGGDTCTVTSNTEPKKRVPQGWVQTGQNKGGYEGRVVVLSYPPPVNGTATASGFNGRSADIVLDWNNGVTLTDAIAP